MNIDLSTEEKISREDPHDLIRAGNHETLKAFCESGHPAGVAESISSLVPQEVWEVIRHAEKHVRSEIFSHLDEDLQIGIIETLPRNEITALVTEMPPDDRADLFKQMPEPLKESVLPALAHAEREDIRRLTAYAEGTVGAVMTSDYATLKPQMSIPEAIEHLRKVAPDRETIYVAFVLDDDRRLLGYTSLKDIIVAGSGKAIKDIMHADFIFSMVDDDQEGAARKIQKYDLLALPVLNTENVLVGIVTHDDALDIITQEHTEDLEKFMAISGEHEAAVYMRTSVLEHFRNRAPWLVVLAILGLVSGLIVQSYEDLLIQFAILATFMPMLADTGGNAGSQSATLVIRALALGEIKPKNFLPVIFKELNVALMLSILLGCVAFARVMLIGGGSTLPQSHSLARVGAAIAIALSLQVVTSIMLGTTLPLVAKRFKFDPAVVASPALTTMVDITGLLIYFSIAKALLGL
ncbi:MAG: magnesium transporter [Victivallales bacterium]|nr:magnesium transporter [Victivallales bacterium]